MKKDFWENAVSRTVADAKKLKKLGIFDQEKFLAQFNQVFLRKLMPELLKISPNVPKKREFRTRNRKSKEYSPNFKLFGLENLSKEKLEHWHKTMRNKDICDKLGFSRNTLPKYLKYFGIKRKNERNKNICFFENSQ